MYRYQKGYIFEGRTFVIDKAHIHNAKEEQFVEGTALLPEPVMLCRECRWWGDEDGYIKNAEGVLCGRCQVHNYVIDDRHTGWCPTENDFCSYGKRRGE